MTQMLQLRMLRQRVKDSAAKEPEKWHMVCGKCWNEVYLLHRIASHIAAAVKSCWEGDCEVGLQRKMNSLQLAKLQFFLKSVC